MGQNYKILLHFAAFHKAIKRLAPANRVGLKTCYAANIAISSFSFPQSSV